MTKNIFVFLSLFNFLLVHGQDLHFSQHYASPLHLNPGMTGVFDFDFKDKDLRFASIYRQQWRTIKSPYVDKSVPFSTSILSADGLIKKHKDMDGNYVGIGSLFYRDKSGDLAYTSLYSNFSISYGLSLSRNHNTYLCSGVSFAIGQNSFDPSNGYFDNQWNGIAFDPSLPTRENFPSTVSQYTDVSAGVSLSSFPSQKSKHTFGFALFHITNPDQTFYGVTAKLPRKLVVHYQGQIPIKYHREIIPLLFYHTQANAYELNSGLMIKFNLRNSEKQDFKDFQFGGAYRLVGNRKNIVGSDALVALVRTRYRNFLFGASYDSNFSGLTGATRTVGAFELSMVYYLDLYKRNKQPRKHMKEYRPVCPDE